MKNNNLKVGDLVKYRYEYVCEDSLITGVYFGIVIYLSTTDNGYTRSKVKWFDETPIHQSFGIYFPYEWLQKI